MDYRRVQPVALRQVERVCPPPRYRLFPLLLPLSFSSRCYHLCPPPTCLRLLSCLVPPLSLPRPRLSSAALLFAAPSAGPSPDSPETRVTTPLRMPPRTSARGAAGLGLPALGSHRPSLPPARAPRTPSRPAVAARPPLPATGLTSAQACRTSFCTNGIVCLPWALPSRPPSTRALHLAVPSVPIFAPPTCAVLLVYRCSSWSSTPLRTVNSSQAAAGHVQDRLFLVLAPLATFLVSACASRFLFAAPSSCLASSAPRSCARWAIYSRKIKRGSTPLDMCQDDYVSTNQRKVKKNENYH